MPPYGLIAFKYIVLMRCYKVIKVKLHEYKFLPLKNWEYHILFQIKFSCHWK